MSRRGLIIALVVSLGVNLFVVGALFGAFVLGQRMHAFHPGPRQLGPLWAAASDLPPERQQAFRQALRGAAGEVGGELRQARQARREAWLSLKSEPFDPAAVTAALGRARGLEMQARAEVERRIVDFAAALTPAERARLAERLAHAGPRRRGPPPGPPRGP
jgi:uncharacterized membrane protein